MIELSLDRNIKSPKATTYERWFSFYSKRWIFKPFGDINAEVAFVVDMGRSKGFERYGAFLAEMTQMGREFRRQVNALGIGRYYVTPTLYTVGDDVYRFKYLHEEELGFMMNLKYLFLVGREAKGLFIGYRPIPRLPDLAYHKSKDGLVIFRLSHMGYYLMSGRKVKRKMDNTLLIIKEWMEKQNEIRGS